MNIIEATNFFVRVTCFDFKNSNQNIKLKFRIIPMIHIGSKEYYQETLSYLKECDEIIYEGIQFKTKASFFNLQQSIAKKVDLVTQNDHLNLQDLSSKLIHADFTPTLGQQEWQKLRFKEKIKMRFINPLVSIYQSWGITRKKLAKLFMHSSQEEKLAYGSRENEPGTALNFVMNAREQIIFKAIDDKMENDRDHTKLIGVLYGAAHMNTICRYLIDHLNYVPHNGVFLKVFDI